MAKVVRFHETGGPDVLRLEDVDIPAPGPGEVHLAIDAIGVNRAEAAFRGGHYIIKPTPPSVLGSEAVGRVLSTGPGVEDLAARDRVLVLPLSMQGQYGLYASEVTIPAGSLTKLPPDVDPVQQAATWVAFLTAWGGLRDAGRLQAGQFVILPAASSSVGLAAIQIARDIGAIPIAATRSGDKAQALLDAGAAHVVATAEQDLPAEIRRITDGRGVPLIFDPVAGPYAATLFGCLAEEGQLIIYGGLANQPSTFPRHLAIRSNLTMRGYNFFGLLRDKTRFQAAYDAIVAGVRDGRFKMPIDATFPLADVVEAHRHLEANQQVGKVVLVV